MRSPFRRPAAPWLALAAVCVSLPACTVTWRQPTIAPIDPVRLFPVSAARACDAALTAFSGLQLRPDETMRQDSSCVIETDYRSLDEPGDPFERLRDVGYVGGGISHGRYLLTATIRENEDGQARVRLAARIEGIDTSYVTVRSNGTIEKVAFERLSAVLGTQPLEPPR